MRKYVKNLMTKLRTRPASNRPSKKPPRPRLGLEGLESREVLSTVFSSGALNIIGTTGNDVIELLSPTTTTTEVRVNGVTEFNGAIAINRIDIDGGAGSDQVLIRGVQSNVTNMANVVNAESVTVGQANASGHFSTANVRSAVNVLGTVDGSLTIRNDASNLPSNVTVTSTRVSGMAPASILYNMQPGGRTRMSLQTGSGADTINISSTIPASAFGLTVSTNGGNDTFNLNGASTVVRLNGGDGNDTFNLSPSSQSLNSLQETVVVNGGTGANSLAMNDQNRAISQTLYDATLDVAPQGGTLRVNQLNSQSGQTDTDFVGFSGIQSVRFSAPTATGASNIAVKATQSGVATTIDSGGASEVRIGDAGSMNRVLGAVTVNRATTGGLLVLDDSAQTAGRTYTLRANSVQRSGLPAVSFDNNIASVRVDAGSGNDSFVASAPRAGSGTYRVTGGAGSDEIRAANTANEWLLLNTGLGSLNERLQFTGIDFLIGGSGDDHFQLNNGAGVTGAIHGNPLVNGNPIPNGGFDTIDYSAYATGVTVNLNSRSGTNIGQGAAARLTGIDAIIGGSGGDTLTGDGGANVIHGKGGNDIIFGGNGRDILIGGAGVDDIRDGNFETIFVAGDTASAIANPAAFKALNAEWTRTDQTYAQRRSHIIAGGGRNGAVALNGTTIVDDGVADVVRAGTATDLIFIHSDDLFGGTPQNPNEIVVL